MLYKFIPTYKPYRKFSRASFFFLRFITLQITPASKIKSEARKGEHKERENYSNFWISEYISARQIIKKSLFFEAEN